MGGPDIPENFLGFTGFEKHAECRAQFQRAYKRLESGRSRLGSWRRQGDHRGHLNYIADKGANCIYFLPMNIGGDGQDTFPDDRRAGTRRAMTTASWISGRSPLRTPRPGASTFDFNWRKPESANENYHDNGTLGPERKLYYRELLARFGHHLGRAIRPGGGERLRDGKANIICCSHQGS